jgi:hypothetical protein
MDELRQQKTAEVKARYHDQREALRVQLTEPEWRRRLLADHYEHDGTGWVPAAADFDARYAAYAAEHAARNDAILTRGLDRFTRATDARLAPRGLRVDPAIDAVVDRLSEYRRRVAELYEEAALHHIDAAPPADRIMRARAFLDAQPYPTLAPGRLRARHQALLQ